jgi:hypothetical protein
MIESIRASKLARPMSCAGSLFFKDFKDEENEAAREGTACGEYLRSLLQPDYACGVQASNGVQIDDDMKYYARGVADKILEVAATNIMCEHELTWQSRAGIAITGHPDATFIGKDGKLYVDDLKYGWGIVEVFENWQLLAYAIGEVIRREQALDVVLRIHQPRPHHEDGPLRTWSLSYAELLGYKERIDARLEQIAKGYDTSGEWTTVQVLSGCRALLALRLVKRSTQVLSTLSISFKTTSMTAP